MQMVIQACWIEESPLLTLPHIEPHQLYLFSLMSKALKKPCTFPAGLKAACYNSYETLAVHLRKEFDDNEIEQIYKASVTYNIIMKCSHAFFFYYNYHVTGHM